MTDRELTVTERTWLVAERLYAGQSLTTEQVMHLCGYTSLRSAYELMYRISRVAPLVFACGVWAIMDRDL